MWRTSGTHPNLSLPSYAVLLRTFPNKFVQLALDAALKIALAQGHRIAGSIEISIVGDNDFYSQDRSVCSPRSHLHFLKAYTHAHQAEAASEPGPFAFLNTTLAEVHKTGLGSSAAMVTSLVAAILLHASGARSDQVVSESTKKLIHNVAQYAHSQAQGKVGSGFDVSAAIFGSQIYRRFAPECLSTLLESTSVSSALCAHADDVLMPVRLSTRCRHRICYKRSHPIRSCGSRKLPLRAQWKASLYLRIRRCYWRTWMQAATRQVWLAKC